MLQKKQFKFTKNHSTDISVIFTIVLNKFNKSFSIHLKSDIRKLKRLKSLYEK